MKIVIAIYAIVLFALFWGTLLMLLCEGTAH